MMNEGKMKFRRKLSLHIDPTARSAAGECIRQDGQMTICYLLSTILARPAQIPTDRKKKDGKWFSCITSSSLSWRSPYRFDQEQMVGGCE